jgi:hypothetical protein
MAAGCEPFGVDDLRRLSEQVASTWTDAVACDWDRPAGTLDWSCRATADHLVDCVYGAAFLLASRRTDGYPEVGRDMTLGPSATPERLVESLGIATHLLVGAVTEADPDEHAILFRRPEPVVGTPVDFPARGAMEVALHAHDVALGLGVPFEPPVDVARRLREHTLDWPLWTHGGPGWRPVVRSIDPWGDLLTASGRARAAAC